MQILSRARPSSAPSSPQPSPPPSPSKAPSKTISLNIAGVANIFLKMRQSPPRLKAHHIESSSGDPQTHPTITLNASERTGPLELKETYICSDAVDMQFLLRRTRNNLLEHACRSGLNTLVNERWTYTICCLKSGMSSDFRVRISYIACCAQSVIPDPHKPVAIDKIKSVPGLMTIRQCT